MYIQQRFETESLKGLDSLNNTQIHGLLHGTRLWITAKCPNDHRKLCYVLPYQPNGYNWKPTKLMLMGIYKTGCLFTNNMSFLPTMERTYQKQEDKKQTTKRGQQSTRLHSMCPRGENWHTLLGTYFHDWMIFLKEDTILDLKKIYHFPPYKGFWFWQTTKESVSVRQRQLKDH